METTNSSPTQPKTIQKQNRDIVSSLPDEILCHMMSFLPAKCAVGTSILSKRWRYTWTSIPDLDFDDTSVSHDASSSSVIGNNYSKEELFMQFVNRVLLLRGDPIKRLHLKVTHNYAFQDLNLWICAAIMHNVQELDLNYFCLQLPQILFRCKTLKILKLHAEIGFKIVEPVCLPRLKVLMIQKFNVPNLEKLLCGSPVLEELIVHRDPGEYYPFALHVLSSTLKRLTIHQTEMKAVARRPYSLVVRAPKLEYLDLKDHLSEEVDIMKLSLLVNATIDVNRCYRNQMLKILSKIINVSVLSLSADALRKSLNSQADGDILPLFRYLTRLEVGVDGVAWLMLPEILKCSPNLEAFTIIKYVARGHSIPADDIFKKVKFVPNCLSTSLESVEFKGFGGNKAEMETLEYLLKNAAVLKKFRISFSTAISFQKEADILKKLIMFPKASTACQFLIA